MRRDSVRGFTLVEVLIAAALLAAAALALSSQLTQSKRGSENLFAQLGGRIVSDNVIDLVMKQPNKFPYFLSNSGVGGTPVVYVGCLNTDGQLVANLVNTLPVFVGTFQVDPNTPGALSSTFSGPAICAQGQGGAEVHVAPMRGSKQLQVHTVMLPNFGSATASAAWARYSSVMATDLASVLPNPLVSGSTIGCLAKDANGCTLGGIGYNLCTTLQPASIDIVFNAQLAPGVNLFFCVR